MTVEPMAWYRDEDGVRMYYDKQYFDDAKPLYSAQREWVGLANEEVKKEVEIEMEYYWDGDYIDTTCARDQLNNFVKTIEAKLKEKNT